MKKNKSLRQKGAIQRFEITIEKYQKMLKDINDVNDENYKTITLKLRRMVESLDNTLKKLKK